MERTEIQKFYKNKTIFITGGTGFLGKILVEKLLRSCWELNRIILPVRSKRDLSVQTRISDYFNNKLFNKLKSDNPGQLDKVMFVSSNIEEDKYGLSSEDYSFVVSTVNIIYHGAATVNFVAPIKEAVNKNVRGTRNLINMAKEMLHLEIFVHLSTMWSSVPLASYTEEKVYPSIYQPDVIIDLVNSFDNYFLNKITFNLLGIYNNSYTFTKQLSEYLIYLERENIPLTIVRVPALTCINHEPIPGWVNNIQNVTRIGMGLAMGISKVLLVEMTGNINILPADFTVNCLIAVAWSSVAHKSNEMKVYNYSSATKGISRKRFCDNMLYSKYPLENAVWTPWYIAVDTNEKHDKYSMFLQKIPAFFCDLCLFRKDKWYQNQTKKYILNMKVSAWFLQVKLDYEFKNVPALWEKMSPDDQFLFNFDINSISWNEYLDIFAKSVKESMKEDLSDQNMKNAQCK